MKKITSVFLLICIIFSLASCLDNADEKKYKTRNRTISGEHFNTFSQISTYADESDEKIESYRVIADELLGRYHKLFDIYYEYEGINNIKTVNDNAGKSPVIVDEELIVFLEYCKELYTITNGKTNIMLGSVLKIWHNCREEASDRYGFLPEDMLPTIEALRAANEHTSIDLLVIDREASSVYIPDPLASIDVGAIAKGYAVDRLYERLVKEGADHAVLNIGGNIRTIGLKPTGDRWVSGITNPNRQFDETLICRLELGESSLVTSGDYERFFFVGDDRYHHIIDPVTLTPARYFSSVSVITEESCLADALSTALFCMSEAEGRALIESLDADVNVIWVDLEYKITHTDGVTFVNS